jgi:hypothetical protein
LNRFISRQNSFFSLENLFYNYLTRFSSQANRFIPTDEVESGGKYRQSCHSRNDISHTKGGVEMFEASTIPGTTIPISLENVQAFTQIRPILAATEGMTLSQICAMTSLEISTVQNWLKRGLIGNVKGKKYTEIQVAKIFIINALKSCMKLDDIRDLLAFVNGAATAVTPDDIISEPELFDYLCGAVQQIRLNLRANLEFAIPEFVEISLTKVLEDFAGSENAKKRLMKALTVMVYAHLSGQCSNTANLLLKQLI